MREVWKPWLKEFADWAYTDLYCMDEDGSGPTPLKGDQFFLLETSEGDHLDQLMMWSAREESFWTWNTRGWWEESSFVPIQVLKIEQHALRFQSQLDDEYLEDMEDLYSSGL